MKYTGLDINVNLGDAFAAFDININQEDAYAARSRITKYILSVLSALHTPCI